MKSRVMLILTPYIEPKIIPASKSPKSQTFSHAHFDVNI